MGNNSALKSLIMSFTYQIIILIFIGYAGINAYLYFFQRSILYLPVKELSEPKNYGLHETSSVRLKTADSLNITAWYTAPKHNEPTLLYLHGNAGNLGDRTEKLEAMAGQGFGILAVSWRGYGTSEGAPTEEGLYNDARAALQYLLDNGTKLENIVLYGESLGTGIAIQMATEYNARALILEAPYTSISSRAAELYPYIPVKLLLKDHFNSIDKIGNVHIPVLIFHGYRDTVMPIHHGRKILEAANEPKEARFFDNVGHTDFDLQEISKITHDFVMKQK